MKHYPRNTSPVIVTYNLALSEFMGIIGSCSQLKKLLIGDLSWSTFLWIRRILALFNLLSNPIVVLYLRFKCQGWVVLKYNYIRLLVFLVLIRFMNVVSSLKFFLILLALFAIQFGKKFVLLVNSDKRPLASDKVSALKMLEVLSKKLSNSIILSLFMLINNSIKSIY